jgi:iron-sulfur cluster repair protein YtfE (RIC family)
MADSCGCGCGHDGGRGLVTLSRRYGADDRVGDVARDPAALAVLARLGVNHCCGGGLSLREGAAAAGVPLDELLRALNAPAAGTPA